MIRPSLIVVSLSCAATVASAFPNVDVTPRKPSATALTAAPSTRRELLRRTAGLGVLSLASVAPRRARAEIRRSPGKCVHGEGDGCDSLAEDNAFIQRLQQKSADNREANEREALNAFYMKNYPGVFAVDDKQMVQKMDGSFALFSADEMRDLVEEGKISREYPMSKGGRIADLTQKPMLVLKE